MTRVCCYCKPYHIMGKDNGLPHTHGMCLKAFIKESIKLWLDTDGPVTIVLMLSAFYFTYQMTGWWMNGFQFVR